MIEPPDDIKNRLLFIQHRAWHEVRDLAKTGRNEQLCDLSDAVEGIAAYMSRWRNEDLQMIRFNLQTYLDKYPESRRFQYVEFLDKWDIPQF